MLAVSGGIVCVSWVPIWTQLPPAGSGGYIGTRPSKASVQNLYRKISDQTAARYGLLDMEQMIASPEPDVDWLGKLLLLRSSQPGLQSDQSAYTQAAATVVLSKVQDQVRGIRAASGKRTHGSWTEAHRESDG